MVLKYEENVICSRSAIILRAAAASKGGTHAVRLQLDSQNGSEQPEPHLLNRVYPVFLQPKAPS